MFIHMFRFKVNIILIRSLPHVEFWAPLWLEKDSHETSHWKLEHPFNGFFSNSSRSISPFFGCLFSHHEAGEPVEPFHKRLCWSTMKGGTWVPLLHCCKLQWAQYEVAVRCLQQMISLIATSTWQNFEVNKRWQMNGDLILLDCVLETAGDSALAQRFSQNGSCWCTRTGCRGAKVVWYKRWCRM